MDASDKPLCYHYAYVSLWFVPDIALEKGFAIQEAKNPNHKFETIFSRELRRGSYWFTDGSKIEANSLDL